MHVLKQHKAAIDIVWHDCPEHGCEYMAKRKGDLKRRRADAHDIGVTWHECPEPNSSHKVKQKGDIKKHRADVHGIGVTWHACTELGCEYKRRGRATSRGTVPPCTLLMGAGGFVSTRAATTRRRRTATSCSTRPASTTSAWSGSRPPLRAQGEAERPPQQAHQEPAHVQVRCEQLGEERGAGTGEDEKKGRMEQRVKGSARHTTGLQP